MITATLPTLIQSFFTDRLLRQRAMSPNTVASYRDTFRLLLRFAAQRLNKQPSQLEIEQLNAAFIGEFLEHLEEGRGNGARTRNTRLAAIRTFYRYVALSEPAYSLLCQQVLAIPNKRFERRPIEFLHRDEIEALLAAPDTSTWIGRRDRTLLLVATQTGLRVSEITALRRKDVVLERGAHVRCDGKGRKERCTPLRKETETALRNWLKEQDGQDDDPVFPALRGDQLSRDAVERLVAKHTATASTKCPTLENKKVTPHTLRHSSAMDLLQHGVDRTVIALWLGHECVQTTQMYLHADLRVREEALARTAPLDVKQARYRPDDRLLSFLEGL
jgi:site-specific recombinase XerD